MPARRNLDKTRANETPLAAIAPITPTRSVSREDAKDGPRNDAVTDDAFVLERVTGDTDSGDAETVEAVPALAPPAPARRAVHKAGNRRPAGVPRTIAELERREAGLPLDDVRDDTANVTTGAEDEGPSDSEDDVPVAEAEEARPVLLVPLRVVGITTAAMWLLAAFAPQAVLIVAQRVGIGSDAGTTMVSIVTLGIGAALALVVLLRAWHGVFGTPPDDLHWRTIRVALARETPTGPGGVMRRNNWRTASLAALFGAGFFVAVFVWQAVSHPSASNFLSLLGFLVTLFAKAITAVVFVGFLQRALTARFPKSRAALLAGAAYGIANVVLLAAVLAAPIQDATGAVLSASQVIEELTFSAAVAFFIYLGIAWFRMKANSVWAAVAFLLTLLILFRPLGILL